MRAIRRYDIYALWVMLAFFLGSCTPKPENAVMSESLPDIYPDYRDVMVPINIAPLNFLLRTPADAVYVTAASPSMSIEVSGRGHDVSFPVKEWHKLLASAVGEGIDVTVSARTDGRWVKYRPFRIDVVADSIDPYLTYRLIEPDYEIFDRLEIQERCIEDFSVRTLCDHNTVGNRCMNCHTYGSCRPDLSFLYVRGEGGGMVLNRDGVMSKLALKTDYMVSGSVYAQFSPSGNSLVFSSNVIIPAFHSDPSKRLEVFDSHSDVYVADLVNDRVLRCPLLCDSTRLETFPTFSPDGKSIYYCVAEGPAQPQSLDSLQYSLCRVGFDEATGKFAESVDTLVKADCMRRGSVCHPRVSPDGRFVLYTVADYGTFPIWHPESDLRMMDLTNGVVHDLDVVNSDKSDTYHCWSSTGRWFVFASKRDDGLYGKPYFCHVDASGRVSKPFVLPQRDPAFYDNCLKSFNVPELGAAPVPFDAYDVHDALQCEAVSFR